MKVLTSAQMREIDRLTIERGIPGIILMENAAQRVVEYLAATYSPLSNHRIVVLCGKGNNGGDGLAIARQLFTRHQPQSLDVVLTAHPEDYQGDAALNLRMLTACGCSCHQEIRPSMNRATLVIDAVLGTGLKGPPTGNALAFIEAINTRFPDAEVIAVDVPSGMNSDEADTSGPIARATASVTFTAPKICHALAPNCDRVGRLTVAPIGSPTSLLTADPNLWLSIVEPHWFAPFFTPRPKDAHKGDFGHILLIGGSVGKTGAIAMSGQAALRAGAGLVTIATPADALAGVAAHCPEVMTEPLPTSGALEGLAKNKSVLAVGPGLGTAPETATLVRALYQHYPLPAIFDADAINCLAFAAVAVGIAPRILTPHPGEMARLTASSTQSIQSDRIGAARTTALNRHVTVVLKGERTLIAFPDGRVWINPTGTPAMATGGTGDILTGIIAGLAAQFPDHLDLAVAASVWLHGRAGELGAAVLGEKSLIATDLLRFLPEAMRELSDH